MSSDTFAFTQTGSVRLRGNLQDATVTRTTMQARRDAARHQEILFNVEKTREQRRDSALQDLAARTEKISRTLSSAEALSALRQHGFSWRDVARIVGVSVPAVQKWRRGEGVTSANRSQISRLLGLTRLLKEEHLILDPVSWLDAPVRSGVHLSKIDLLAAGFEALVLELATTGPDVTITDTQLSEFDKEWRSKYIDGAFEVHIGLDGIPTIRPRR